MAKKTIQYSECVIGLDDLRTAIINARTKVVGMDCDPRDISVIGNITLTWDGSEFHLEISTK